MERKYIAILACLGILMLMLAGCQGYKPPKYKSPGEDTEGSDSGQDNAEEVDIDMSELDDTEEGTADTDVTGDQGSDDNNEYQAVDEEDEPYVPPAATVKNVEKYEPEDKYVEADYEPLNKDEATDEDSEFVKAAYEPLNEEELDDMPTLTVTEGEIVKINVKAQDADGDSLTYRFTAPLNSEGEWRTRTGDSGVYYSTVSVSDGKEDVENKIRIVVEPRNNKPTIEVATTIRVDEGDTVTLNPRIYDADGDRTTVSYSGWMTTDTKVASYTDAGEHTVKITVTDGISRVSQEVTVIVEDVNRPPEVEIEF